MKTRARQCANPTPVERGIALVSSMMALLLLTGMGLAIALSATTETAVSANYRRNEQAFFAADAGVGLTREALRIQLNSAIQSAATAAAPNITFPASGQAFDDSQITNILTNSSLTSQSGAPITNALSAVSARASALNSDGSFSVAITLAPVGSPVLGTRPAAVNGINQPPSTVTMQYAYTITSTGDNNLASGNSYRATAQANEQGVVNITLNTTVNQNPVSNPTITRAFSSYAAFFNRFNQGGVLTSGTFSGPVHTNERFRFSSSYPLIFQGAVTQAGSSTYDYDSTAYTVNNTNRSGLTFQSTYGTTSTVPLPSNVYSQQLAVLNSTGQTDSTFTSAQPTTTQLTTNLRQANNTAPGTTSGVLNNGVYVPSSDGTNITGGGIYVQGNADEIQMSVNGSSINQVYTIRQGSTTTTITVVPPNGGSAGSTTIASGSSSTTFSGVPLDKTISTNIKPGASLFVNGNILSLHGPAASGGATGPAISSSTGVTVTSIGDITITGDLKLQQTIVNTDGTLATGGMTATNVLGIFTNSGIVNLTPSTTYTAGNYSLTLDAAIAAFNEAALNSNSSATTGGIYFNCGSCSLNSSSNLLIRGSRIQSAILSIGYGVVNGSKRNVFFDPRFANGAFAPPFFPVTQLANNSTTTTTFSVTLATSNVATQSNTWQRIMN